LTQDKLPGIQSDVYKSASVFANAEPSFFGKVYSLDGRAISTLKSINSGSMSHGVYVFQPVRAEKNFGIGIKLLACMP
jgi:hypothetical protein